ADLAMTPPLHRNGEGASGEVRPVFQQGRPGTLPPVSADGCRGLMRLEEVAHLVYRLGEQVFWLSPGIDRHFSLRRQRRDIHGDRVRVRWCVVRHHQYWRLAGTDEVARYAVYEVGLDAIEVMQVRFDGRHRHVGPLGA